VFLTKLHGALVFSVLANFEIIPENKPGLLSCTSVCVIFSLDATEIQEVDKL
jgi:hypothetical protein